MRGTRFVLKLSRCSRVIVRGRYMPGSAVFNVARYDSQTGEIAGVFESIQPSDTDLGSKVGGAAGAGSPGVSTVHPALAFSA